MSRASKKPGSVSISANLNQADDISVKSRSLIKGLKVLVSSKSNQAIDAQKQSKKDKADLKAEADPKSLKEIKATKRGPIPFSLSIFTKSSKYQKSSLK